MSHFVFPPIFSTLTLSITSNLQLITFRFYPLRWTNGLNFKYFGNIWWNGGIVSGVNLNDKTGKITQGTDGNLRWTDAKSKWDDYGTYRMTVDMNTNPQTVTFEKL